MSKIHEDRQLGYICLKYPHISLLLPQNTLNPKRKNPSKSSIFSNTFLSKNGEKAAKKGPKSRRIVENIGRFHKQRELGQLFHYQRFR